MDDSDNKIWRDQEFYLKSFRENHMETLSRVLGMSLDLRELGRLEMYIWTSSEWI